MDNKKQVVFLQENTCSLNKEPQPPGGWGTWGITCNSIFYSYSPYAYVKGVLKVVGKKQVVFLLKVVPGLALS